MQALARLSLFLIRMVVLGLAVAFLVVYFHPSILTGPGRLAPFGDADSYANAVDISSPSVVNVHSARRTPAATAATTRAPQPSPSNDAAGAPLQPATQNSLGSGVIVSADGYILTNYHVIRGADAIRVGLTDGRSADATVVGVDPETDLALLKIKLPHLKPIEMGRSDSLHVGDIVLAIGDPYGVGQTVTQGIVSALGRSQLGLSTFENFIQTDAAINPGNSGGALINAKGQLVGINTALYSPNGSSNGIGFAIPVNLARGVMQQLIAYGHVRRGYLGIEPQNITPKLAAAYQLKNTDGVVIDQVAANGPASAADLQPGEIIQTIDGEMIANSDDALTRIASKPPGTVVTLGGIRDGQHFSVRVKIAERPETSSP